MRVCKQVCDVRNLDSRIWEINPTNDWNPESTACNPELKTVLDSLTWCENIINTTALILVNRFAMIRCMITETN